MSLTTRERAALKARAHALEPTVQIGHAGVTDAVVAEAERALTAHELIKVRVGGLDRDVREALGDELAGRTDAAVVQRVGKILVLWRPRPLADESATADPGEDEDDDGAGKRRQGPAPRRGPGPRRGTE